MLSLLRRYFGLALGCLLLGSSAAADAPNLVIMLADDMGFGELQCLNPRRGKIPTPQLDAIAAAVDYVGRRAADKQPFLLYVPWSSPHSPFVPSKQWEGRSGLNKHADFVMQTDDSFGQVMKALVVHHSVSGYFAVRHGDWKLALCRDSGGWTAPKPSAAKWKQYQRDGLPLVQLYDMSADLGEQTNLAPQHSDTVASLRALLEEQVRKGRSTPGPNRSNDVEVVIDKRPKGKS